MMVAALPLSRTDVPTTEGFDPKWLAQKFCARTTAGGASGLSSPMRKSLPCAGLAPSSSKKLAVTKKVLAGRSAPSMSRPDSVWASTAESVRVRSR